VTALALKVLLAPGFIVATSLVSRRFGVGIAGVVGGLPAIAGPILLVVALEHGHGFARSTATGVLLGIVGLIVFVLAFAVVSKRARWPWALAAGWGCFIAVIAALHPVHVGPVAALVVACAACVCGLVLLPRPTPAGARPQAHPPFDLALRGACAVVPVVSVTAAAQLLGPHLSGLVASFPVITPVLAAFTQAQHGPVEAVRLLRGMTVGFFAYTLFCFTVAVSIGRLGTAAAFVLAMALALVAQTAAVAIMRRREQLLPAGATV
jgi:uncharacterized membrane protein (GlpM family)